MGPLPGGLFANCVTKLRRCRARDPDARRIGKRRLGLGGDRAGLRQRQHRGRKHGRRFRSPQRRVADATPRLTLCRGGTGHGHHHRVTRRHPGERRRPLCDRGGRGQQPDLGPAHPARRVTGTRAGKPGRLRRHRADQRRGAREPCLCRERRRQSHGDRQRLHRFQAQSGRASDAALRSNRFSARHRQPGRHPLQPHRDKFDRRRGRHDRSQHVPHRQLRRGW